ncbi:MAG: nicotinate-nucleotide adenylyltransferase [Armatimonadota bacterium]
MVESLAMASPGSTLKRVAVLGGTFDPVHYGHLAAAELVADQYELDRVIFLPNRLPPHKPGHQISPPEDRYLMTVLATNSNPRFTVSRLELEREGPSYTLDTLRSLRAELGPECAVYFIIGADAVLEIATWHGAEAVLREGRFIAVHRPGYDLARLSSVIGPAGMAHIEPLALPELDISSTGLRERVAAGQSIRYLTPEAVVDYISRRGLYQAGAG